MIECAFSNKSRAFRCLILASKHRTEADENSTQLVLDAFDSKFIQNPQHFFYPTEQNEIDKRSRPQIVLVIEEQDSEGSRPQGVQKPCLDVGSHLLIPRVELNEECARKSKDRRMDGWRAVHRTSSILPPDS